MEEAILEGLSLYYGLDWLALVTGMIGTYMITKRSRWGFVFCTLGCSSGIVVAALSMQIPYVAYNAALVFMMMKGFCEWGAKPVQAEVPAVPESRLRITTR